jgi:chaperonin GroEL
VVIAKILEKESNGYGYDAQAGEYGDLMSKGIIDPAKVVRAALQGAASVAGLLISHGGRSPGAAAPRSTRS